MTKARFGYQSTPFTNTGGIWETMVQSVKRALKSVAGKHWVNDETLLTFMAEVESLLNAHPLTHVSVGPRDEETLTPNHFLVGRASPNVPQDVVCERDLYSRKVWKHAQVMTDHFWKRWLREYLPALAKCRKWTKEVPDIYERDLVLIVDEYQPRGRWPSGRVLRPTYSRSEVCKRGLHETGGETLYRGEYRSKGGSIVVSDSCPLVVHGGEDVTNVTLLSYA